MIKNALRDEAGHPFDLQQYVDQDACFISEKFKDGKILKALELAKAGPTGCCLITDRPGWND